MAFFYCPESAFLAFTPTVEVGTALTDSPVSRLTDYFRPDITFRHQSPDALTVRATLTAPATVQAAVLLDPSWIADTSTGVTLAGDALAVGVNVIDQRTTSLWVPDTPTQRTSLDLVIPANTPARSSYYAASVLLLCGEWNQLGSDPQNPIQRRRVAVEPYEYLTLEEEWILRLDDATEVARWLGIRRAWDQVYVWEQDVDLNNPRVAPALLLGRLTEPPRIDRAIGGGITQVACTWRSMPARINMW